MNRGLKLNYFKTKAKVKRKKGQVFEILFIISFIITIGISLLVSKFVLTNFNNALEESGIHTTESKAAVEKVIEAYVTIDYMILFVVIGLAISLFISSFFIPSHPAFLVINIVGLFALVFCSALMSNIYAEFISADNDAFYSVVSDGSFSKTSFIINKLPWICCIIVFISTILMYAKQRGG